MRVLFALLLLFSPGLLTAADDPSLPAGDQRAIRELQDKAFGVPTLPTDAPKAEGLLALAELGSAATKPGDQALQADDYAALLALLQRYRDDLLKMGMDSSQLQAQLSILEARTKELEARLNALQPRDGLKIFGRFYSAFDDLEVLGPGSIPGVGQNGGSIPGSPGKPAGVGVRTVLGEVHTELNLEGTRGPVTGYAEMDLVLPWGESTGQVGLRKVMVEMRLPVTLQVGDLDAFLTPLTLWRDDSYQPFQSSLFVERYQRQEDDLLLKPNAWPLTGVRASTDALIFHSVTLHLQSLSGIVGYASGGGLSTLAEGVVYTESPTEGDLVLAERYDTFLQGWQVSAPLLENRLTLGYEGLIFFDDASTAPSSSSVSYVPMNETVQSLSAAYHSDAFVVNGEAAASSYQEPWQNNTPLAVEGALTGTALTADGTWQGDRGHLRVFGRYVTSGFHASGAQGRTEDYAYQFLGPFMTENSQVGANGQMGLEGTNIPLNNNLVANIPLSTASRLNDQLIPPGVYVYGSSQPGGVWKNLLAYGPGEEIDPYGVASPNRAGGGVEASYKFFNGSLVPLASAEAFQELNDVTNTAGATVDPFAMTRYRGGLTFDFEPLIKFPLRVGGGVTMTDSADGQTGANGIANNMSTQTLDASVQWNAGRPVGIQAGYRHMTAQGQDETFVFESSGETWDILGAGVWWRPMPAISVDVTATEGRTTVADNPASVVNGSMLALGTLQTGNLQWDQVMARVTTEF